MSLKRFLLVRVGRLISYPVRRQLRLFEAACHEPEAVQTATGGRGAILILESVGGEVFQGCLRCWAPRGRLVVYGKASGRPGVAGFPGPQFLPVVPVSYPASVSSSG